MTEFFAQRIDLFKGEETTSAFNHKYFGDSQESSFAPLCAFFKLCPLRPLCAFFECVLCSIQVVVRSLCSISVNFLFKATTSIQFAET